MTYQCTSLTGVTHNSHALVLTSLSVYPWLRKQFFRCKELFQSSDLWVFHLIDWQTGGIWLDKWVSQSTWTVTLSHQNEELRETSRGFFFLTETSWYNCVMIICIISNIHTHWGTADTWSFRSLYTETMHLLMLKTRIVLHYVH